MSQSQILEGLKDSIYSYDGEAAVNWAQKSLEQKIDPVESLNALTEAITVIGNSYSRGDLFLPELVGAADAVKRAMPCLEEEIKRRGIEVKGLGTIVIGTVYGDIHDIGKTMVGTMLTAGGFMVHDLGINITAAEFIAAVRKEKPDILAMSSLLTTTAPEQKKVIQALKEQGLRDELKIIIGGGAITEGFAKDIGADGYAPTAPGALELARNLLECKP